MYIEYYGLRMEPFRLSPDHRFCIHHPSFARAKAYMQYALHRREGFVVVTGRPGTGKTTLLDELTQGFGETKFQSARLVSARLEANDLLRMVCYAFGVPAEGAGKPELLQRFSNYISRSFKGNRRPLLIVDEAQGLSHGALEELRLLTNQHLNGQPLLQIFLVGQEELRDLLADPSLEQLRQRIVAACHIEPLKPEQTSDYVLHRLRTVGWEGNPSFDSALFPLLYRFTQGIPRVINQVCSRLLLHGSLEGRATLGVEDIELVIKELRSEHLTIGETNSIVDLKAFENESLETLSRPEQSPVTESQPLGERLVHADISLKTPVEKVVQEVEEVLQQGSEVKKTASVNAPKTKAAGDTPSRRISVEPVPGDAPVPLRPRRDYAPLWGIAATVALSLSLTGLTLLSAPGHELEQLAPVSTWERLGVTRARDMVFRWTRGNWPLCESACAPVVDEPVATPAPVDAPIKNIARVERIVPVQVVEQVSVVKPMQMSKRSERKQNPGFEEQRKPAETVEAQILLAEADSTGEEPRVESAQMPERSEQQQNSDANEQRMAAEMVNVVETQTALVEADTTGRNPRELMAVSQVSFGFDSTRIQPEYTRLLDQVASVLKSSGNSSAHIVGYTDSTGSAVYNERLSRHRAEAVAAYIRDKGVLEQRLQVEGQGLELSEKENTPGSGAGRTVKIFLKRGTPALARLISSDID